MEKIFEGKVAIVTGARTGMGLAASRKFAERGAAVVMAGRNEPVDEAAALRDEGYKAISVKCDVSKSDDCKKLVEAAVKEFGRLDYAYNNAGIQQKTLGIIDTPLEYYHEIMSINCDGIWYCMHYELPEILKQGGGAIVNCSSVGAITGNPGMGSYHAAKHAVIGMTKSAGTEFGPQGINVNAILPGTIYTPMVQKMMDTGNWSDHYVDAIPAKRMGTADEIADVVMWLCSPASSYVMGASIVVDGGFTII